LKEEYEEEEEPVLRYGDAIEETGQEDALDGC
jgi:hypothetical protein